MTEQNASGHRMRQPLSLENSGVPVGTGTPWHQLPALEQKTLLRVP
jgi:hypothetical protein